MEHLQHFGLRRDPFCNEPIPDQFLELAPHRDALLRLGRAVHQRRGLCVLSGEVGSGKTSTVRQLLETLEEELFEASMMVVLNAAADAAWIMTRFAKQLGIEEPAAEREALVAQIYENLAIVREDGRHAVLIIDDAEALSGGRALADVCGLLKLEYEDRRLLSLVLCGGPPLAAALAADPALAGRVEVKVTLAALDREASRDYLMRRIKAGGGAVTIVQDEAMDALHEVGQGMPGRMNTLADNALFEAFLAARTQITRVDVERAHRDLVGGVAASVAVAPVPLASSAPAAGAAVASAPETPRRAAPSPASPQPLEELDSDLDAAFAIGPGSGGADDALDRAEFSSEVLVEAPPKREEPEVDDLLVELIED